MPPVLSRPDARCVECGLVQERINAAAGRIPSNANSAANIIRALIAGLKFAHVLCDYGLTRLLRLNREACHQRCARRLRAMAESAGGLYAKAAQHFANLHSLLEPAYLNELKHFIDRAPSTDLAGIELVLEASLNCKALQDLGSNGPGSGSNHPLRVSTEASIQIGDLFSHFFTPDMGSATIGQVHLATLKCGCRGGRRVLRRAILPFLAKPELRAAVERLPVPPGYFFVAVKVQHQTVVAQADGDIRAMEFGANVMRRLFPAFGFHWLAEIVKKVNPQERDFLLEAENLTEAARLYNNFRDRITIPAAYIASREVLVMEYCPGYRIQDEAAFARHEWSETEVFSLVAELSAHMIFGPGMVNTDPHPGNFLIAPDPRFGWRIVSLDWGQVQRLTDQQQLDLASLLIAAAADGETALANALQVACSAGAGDEACRSPSPELVPLAETDKARRLVFANVRQWCEEQELYGPTADDEKKNQVARILAGAVVGGFMQLGGEPAAIRGEALQLNNRLMEKLPWLVLIFKTIALLQGLAAVLKVPAEDNVLVAKLLEQATKLHDQNVGMTVGKKVHPLEQPHR